MRQYPISAIIVQDICSVQTFNSSSLEIRVASHRAHFFMPDRYNAANITVFFFYMYILNLLLRRHAFAALIVSLLGLGLQLLVDFHLLIQSRFVLAQFLQSRRKIYCFSKLLSNVKAWEVSRSGHLSHREALLQVRLFGSQALFGLTRFRLFSSTCFCSTANFRSFSLILKPSSGKMNNY